MVAKNLSSDHRFICYTDSLVERGEGIELRDPSGWGVQGWFNKLKLFDRTVLDEEFLFLDLALVIKASLDPMVTFARQSQGSLIGMRDWNYDCFGSMVMWVKPDDHTQQIWDTYASGKRYPTKTAVDGDQDFIDSCMTEFWPEGRLDHFPQEWFASYKNLRRLRDRNPTEMQKQLDAAMFLKFHGPPKMHELLDNRRHAQILLEQKPMKFLRYWNFLREETRTWWQ
jgi:hypothetical protein